MKFIDKHLIVTILVLFVFTFLSCKQKEKKNNLFWDSIDPAEYFENLQNSGEIKSMKIVIDDHVDNRFASLISSLIKDRISDRSDVVLDTPSPQITVSLSIDPKMSPDQYSIFSGNKKITLTAGGESGLLYAVGRFLHTSGYHNRKFYPSLWEGNSTPTSSLRGIYFATHFFNWYQVAPYHEVEHYIEDLALWGYNAIVVVYPIINLDSFQDPEADKVIQQMRKIFDCAKKVKMEVGMIFVGNADFKIPRKELAATPNPDPLGRRGNNGNNVCPSKPGGTEYILKNVDDFYKKLGDYKLDLLCLWPYDEGGCACANCYPWGVKGYLPICEKITTLVRRYNPETKVILSTWMYDTPEEGEWVALKEYFDNGKGNWINYIMADAHEDFPRYPLEHSIPGNRPLVNFPEISMWGLSPWGGYGANPLPHRFFNLWKQVKDKVTGGFPYSEGIYEDINKVVISQLYWDKNIDLENILAMYIGYEYDFTYFDQIKALIEGIEKNHTNWVLNRQYDREILNNCLKLARETDSALTPETKNFWRWRILYIRAKLDYIRYPILESETKKHYHEALNSNPEAVDAMQKLVKIYHAMEIDDGSCLQHSWVRPPLRK